MKQFKKKMRADGTYSVIFEYRRKSKLGGKTFYKSKAFYPNFKLSPTKFEESINMAWFEFKKEMDKKFNMEIDATVTFEEYANTYLESLKKRKSLTNYQRNLEVSKYVIQELGRYSLDKINQPIIQNFIDNLNGLEKKTVTIKVVKDFKKIVNNSGFNYTKLVNELGVPRTALDNAFNGKNVSEEWALHFCEQTGLEFDKLFIKEEIIGPYKYNTLIKYYSFLRACLNSAVKEGLIPVNYAGKEYITLFDNVEATKEIDCMNTEEFKKFYDFVLSYPKVKVKAAFFILLNTGIRKEELLGLKWDAIDFKERTMSIRGTVTYVNGYGKQKNENITKNQSSKRIISISGEVLSVIQELKETLDYESEEDLKNKYIFVNEKGEVLSPFTINRWYKELLEECGLKSSYTPHSLRHSYASLLLKSGTDILEVSNRLGHSRVSTTLDIYGHLMDDKKELANTRKMLDGKLIDNSAEEIDNETLLSMYENGEITKEVYLKYISKK